MKVQTKFCINLYLYLVLAREVRLSFFLFLLLSYLVSVERNVLGLNKMKCVNIPLRISLQGTAKQTPFDSMDKLVCLLKG